MSEKVANVNEDVSLAVMVCSRFVFSLYDFAFFFSFLPRFPPRVVVRVLLRGLLCSVWRVPSSSVQAAVLLLLPPSLVALLTVTFLLRRVLPTIILNNQVFTDFCNITLTHLPRIYS